MGRLRLRLAGWALAGTGHETAYLRKPIKNKMSVETIAAMYNSKIWLALWRVRAMSTTATQINKIVAKIDAYFISRC